MCVSRFASPLLVYSLVKHFCYFIAVSCFVVQFCCFWCFVLLLCLLCSIFFVNFCSCPARKTVLLAVAAVVRAVLMQGPARKTLQLLCGFASVIVFACFRQLLLATVDWLPEVQSGLLK